MNKALPRRPGVKPKCPLDALDNRIHALEEARPLFNAILAKAQAHRESVKGRQVRLHPKADTGTPLREFCGINPTDGWLRVNERPIYQIETLREAGLITVTKIGTDWLAFQTPKLGEKL